MAKDAAERRVSLAGRLPSRRRPTRARVLVALPDAETAGRVSRGFAAEGLVPVLAFSSEQALDRLEEDRYSLVLLGRLPGISRTIRTIAHAASAPIVTLGSGEEVHFETMVEDRIDPSATPGEVVARCVSVVRISRPVQLPSILRWGPLELDPAKRSARWRGRRLTLTCIQFRVMEILVLAASSVVTPGELSRHIWGPHAYDDAERVLAHVRRIRKKIEAEPSKPRFLLTVRGEGYRLADQEIREPAIDLSLIEHEGALSTN